MLNPVNDVLLSVIVPVYNAAAYLERCIASLLQQDESRFEVIFINDGSTDHSLSLLQNYAHYSHFHIIDTVNGGVSSARNHGIRASRGKFLCFLDADDFLPSTAFSTWLCLMQQNVCMAVGQSQHFTPQGQPLDFPLASDHTRPMTVSAAINELLYFNPRHGICDKVFRGDVIRQHHLRFNEEIYNFEDLLFVMNYLWLQQHRQVVFSDKVVYHYVKSAHSATRSPLKEKHFSFARSFSSMKAFLSVQHSRCYYHLYLKVTSSYIYKAINSEGFSRDFIDEYISLYRKYFKAYLSSGLMINAWSLYFTLFFLSPRLVSRLRKWLRK